MHCEAKYHPGSLGLLLKFVFCLPPTIVSFSPLVCITPYCMVADILRNVLFSEKKKRHNVLLSGVPFLSTLQITLLNTLQFVSSTLGSAASLIK